MPSRGPSNDLHHAAIEGSAERTLAVLSRGGIDIDQATPGPLGGVTPLMMAAGFGFSRVVTVLLENGANVTLTDDEGYTALHQSAERGHLATTKLLVQGGADLEAKTCTGKGGCTPLFRAAENRHLEVVKMLIEAGADPNSRRMDGGTPLFWAAQEGDMDALKVLLRAKANPLLPLSSPSGKTFVPLDVAATRGHLEIVQELIQERGIEGCGGGSGGVDALTAAARYQHVYVMELLTSAGVVDTGKALRIAAGCGTEASVKFLLQQWKRNTSGERAGYLDTRDPTSGITPLFCSMRACCPRITRMLVDAGADTTTVIQPNIKGVDFDDTVLAYTEVCLASKITRQSQRHSLEAIRRLLVRVEAVHAVSWVWASNAHAATHAAAESTDATAPATSIPLISMLPILRRRAGKPRVLLASLLRRAVYHGYVNT